MYFNCENFRVYLLKVRCGINQAKFNKNWKLLYGLRHWSYKQITDDLKNSTMKTKKHLEKEKLIFIKIKLTILFLIFTLNIFGQIRSPYPNIQDPTPTLQDLMPGMPNLDLTPTIPGFDLQYHDPVIRANAQIELYERLEIEQQRRQQQLEIFYREYAEMNAKNILNFSLPSCASIEGAFAYQKAFFDLLEMTETENSFSIAKVVFIVENAYYENMKSYHIFEKAIKEIGQFLNWKMQEYGLDTTDNLAKNMLLFRFFFRYIRNKVKKSKALSVCL